MATLRSGPVEPYTLPPAEAAEARKSSDAIAALLSGDAPSVTVHLADPASGRGVVATLNSAVLRLLTDALTQMAAGHAIALLPLDAELSTQQAADLLGVSRPYLVKLLDEGRLAHRKVGSQRRVRFEELRRYANGFQREAVAAAENMTAKGQELGLYEHDGPCYDGTDAVTDEGKRQ